MSVNWYLGFTTAAVFIVFGIFRLPRKMPRYAKKYEGEKYDFACKTAWRYMWQFGLLFLALNFMLMRSTRLMAELGQTIILGALLVVEFAAVKFLHIPVERAMAEKFGEDTEE